MKLKNNQSGTTHIVAILLVILIVAVGVVGWRVWDNSKDKSNSSSSNSQSENKDATKQLSIPEWGVQFEIPSTVSDLEVDKITDYSGSGTPSSVAILDSPALEAAGKIKTSGTQERHEKLGQIVRQKAGTDYYPGQTIESYAEANNTAGVKVGDYYYIYVTTYASDNAETYLNAIKSSIQSTLGSVN